MSLTLKRVPLDFDWPLRKIWQGYENTLDDGGVRCTLCNGDGMTPECRFLHETYYRHNINDTGFFGAFIGTNMVAVPDAAELKHMGWPDRIIQNIEWARKAGFTSLTHWSDKLDEEDIRLLAKAKRLDEVHIFRRGKWIKPKSASQITPDDINRFIGMYKGSISGFEWAGTKRRLRKMGAKHACGACKGKGHVYHDIAKKKAYDRWKRTEPPKGPGFQLWETVTDGSPISPVFESGLELATWAEEHPKDCNESHTLQVWLKMIMTDSVDAGSMFVSVVKGGQATYTGHAAEMPE